MSPSFKREIPLDLKDHFVYSLNTCYFIDFSISGDVGGPSPPAPTQHHKSAPVICVCGSRLTPDSAL